VRLRKTTYGKPTAHLMLHQVVLSVMKALSERFAWARGEAGLSQAELARAIKISPSAVNQIEKGHTQSLKAATALAMERVTGVAADWLMDGRGDPHGAAMPASRDAQVRRMSELLETLPQAHRDKIEAEIRFLLSLRSTD
jgi:transcriptional regulator with XRE-family HTH domain